MSLTRYVELWCEGAECQETAGFEPTPRLVRRYARSHGWMRKDGRDFCPKHAEEQP